MESAPRVQNLVWLAALAGVGVLGLFWLYPWLLDMVAVAVVVAAVAYFTYFVVVARANPRPRPSAPKNREEGPPGA